MIANHRNQSTPVCPHCEYAMTLDDMVDCNDADLFSVAPNEDKACVHCPSCDKEFWVKGGYTPKYTTAFAEELL